MDFVEIIGYIAMVTVAISFLFKDVNKLRLVNSTGAFLFIIYGFFNSAYPVVGLNLFVVSINLYYILKTPQE